MRTVVRHVVIPGLATVAVVALYFVPVSLGADTRDTGLARTRASRLTPARIGRARGYPFSRTGCPRSWPSLTAT